MKDATVQHYTMQPTAVRENLKNWAINNVFVNLILSISLDSVQIKVLYEA